MGLKYILIALVLGTFSLSVWASDIVTNYMNCSLGPIKVPPGNQNERIPEIPKSSLKNLKHWRYSPSEMMDFRYEDLKNKLIDNNYMPFILDAAKAFALKPSIVLGAIVGEHVFNLDMKDSAQDYLLRLPGWMRRWVAFEEEFEIPLKEILKQNPYEKCHLITENYEKWNCFGHIWNEHYRGKRCHTCRSDSHYPAKSLKFTFFSPFGSTYGIGQLGPMKALMVADIVHQRAPHIPLIDLHDIENVYRSVLDPELSFYYVAATVFKAIEIYKEKACFDISTNTGVTATLYNLGNERTRAKKRRKAALDSLRMGTGLSFPAENYYGWYVNKVESDLEKILEDF